MTHLQAHGLYIFGVSLLLPPCAVLKNKTKLMAHTVNVVENSYILYIHSAQCGLRYGNFATVCNLPT